MLFTFAATLFKLFFFLRIHWMWTQPLYWWCRPSSSARRRACPLPQHLDDRLLVDSLSVPAICRGHSHDCHGTPYLEKTRMAGIKRRRRRPKQRQPKQTPILSVGNIKMVGSCSTIPTRIICFSQKGEGCPRHETYTTVFSGQNSYRLKTLKVRLFLLTIYYNAA